MTSAIFLILAAAMYAAATGRRTGGLALFGAAAVLGLLWFNHHLTDALALDF